MSAFMDSGHRWWMQCSACDMAWFIGERPEHGGDAEEECRRCKVGGDTALRAEGYAKAREQAAVLVAEWGDGEPLDIIYRRIRAMQDEMAAKPTVHSVMCEAPANGRCTCEVSR